ncbi:hypothetical protein CN067_20930 [Sinorhizobium meliloti]|uniref:hypothetical protein n=1 Tax=Rhizobium meliloti TaxID=382 RepID=UPI000FD8A444|nr:hypothetical protein [Sinorhizobium meliloti]RVQ17752.1 hypothetical protein CN067_20930 [Sinorhizobium meliloti]
MSEFILHNVLSVAATDTVGIYEVMVDATDASGSRDVSAYLSRPEGVFGLNPKIRDWLAENPDFPIAPYVPPPVPTPEEARAAMPPITARQFRLGLVRAGLTPAQVTAAIEAMPDGTEKETALIEWGYASSFERTHPLIPLVGGVLGLSDEQIDALWPQALSL